jgi:hypothetical protein
MACNLEICSAHGVQYYSLVCLLRTIVLFKSQLYRKIAVLGSIDHATLD